MLVDGELYATEMVVCGTCGEVRGLWREGSEEWPEYRQGCKCVPGDTEPWPRVDFQTRVELCYVCGAEALPSGSRFSQYLCSECKQPVIQLNKDYGRCIIPIGRHSIMNGLFYNAESARLGVSVAQFAVELQDFAGTHGELVRWRRRQVIANLKACGLARQPEVPLEEYLAACKALPVDKEEAFAGVCRRYGVLTV